MGLRGPGHRAARHLRDLRGGRREAREQHHHQALLRLSVHIISKAYNILIQYISNTYIYMYI